MRPLFVVVAFLCAVLTGCGRHGGEAEVTEEQKKIAQLQRDLDRMARSAEMKDQYIRSATRTVNEIEGRLDSVTRTQTTVTRLINTNPETGGNQSQRQRMLDDVTAMQEAMTRSRGQVRNLREAVRSSRYRISELERLVTTLGERVAQKDSQITVLTLRVEGLEQTVARQQQQIQEQTRQIEEQERVSREQTAQLARQEQELHTGYYEYGAGDALAHKGLIEWRGGVLRMGRSVVLKPGYNDDKDRFTPIDLRITGEILIHHRSGERVSALLPERSAASYRLERESEGTTIKIVEPDVFWRDKFLVVLLSD